MLNLSGYKLSLDDEFSASLLDTAKWSTQFPFSPADHLASESERYQNVGSASDPFRESDGILTITAAPDPALGAGLCSSGRIGSENDAFNFELGTYIEARVQLPAGYNTGMWPAFWTAAKDEYWPPEMDTLEKVQSTSSGLDANQFSFGDVTKTWKTGNLQGNSSYKSGANLTNSYHTFGTMWAATNVLTEYFDGVEIASGTAPSDWIGHPMYVEANLAVGSSAAPANWAGPPDGLSHSMKIDYIRGYSINQAPVALQAVSSPDGGGINFYGASTTTTLGSGTEKLILQLSEDAFQGDAQANITIDGKFVGIATITAAHIQGQDTAVTINGSWDAGVHTVGVRFTNDLYASGVGDRNLYLDSASYDGNIIAITPASLMSSGSTSMATFQSNPPITLGTGADKLVLQLSEDAFQGDAQAHITINGTSVSTAIITALHSQGQDVAVTIKGNWKTPNNNCVVTFSNDLYISGVGDRNLYLDSVRLMAVLSH